MPLITKETDKIPKPDTGESLSKKISKIEVHVEKLENKYLPEEIESNCGVAVKLFNLFEQLLPCTGHVALFTATALSSMCINTDRQFNLVIGAPVGQGKTVLLSQFCTIPFVNFINRTTYADYMLMHCGKFIKSLGRKKPFGVKVDKRAKWRGEGGIIDTSECPDFISNRFDIITDGESIFHQNDLGKLLQLWNALIEQGVYRGGDQYSGHYVIGDVLNRVRHGLILACVAKDSEVYVNDKLVTIDKVNPGQYVYSFDERSKNLSKSQVINRLYKGKKKVYLLRTQSRNIKCTAEHKFLVYERKPNNNYEKYIKFVSSDTDLSINSLREWSKKLNVSTRTLMRWFANTHIPHKFKGYQLIWKELKDLNVGDKILVLKKRPYKGKPFKLPKIEKKTYKYKRKIPEFTDDDFMYLVGFYLGDGYITKGKYSTIVFCPSNLKEAVKIKSLINKLFNCKGTISRRKHSNQLVVTIFSNAVAKLFKQLQLTGNAHTKRVPKWVFNLPVSQIKSLIEGYVDADGHKEFYRWSLSSCNKNLLRDIQKLCNIIGWKVSDIVKRKYENFHILGRKKGFTGYGYGISIYSVNQDKKKKYQDFCKTVSSYLKLDVNYFGLEKIKEIKPLGEEEVYDLVLDSPHNYIANGIIVHNCTTHEFEKYVLSDTGWNSRCVLIMWNGLARENSFIRYGVRNNLLSDDPMFCHEVKGLLSHLNNRIRADVSIESSSEVFSGIEEIENVLKNIRLEVPGIRATKDVKRIISAFAWLNKENKVKYEHVVFVKALINSLCRRLAVNVENSVNVKDLGSRLHFVVSLLKFLGYSEKEIVNYVTERFLWWHSSKSVYSVDDVERTIEEIAQPVSSPFKVRNQTKFW